jgi:hypothetical protein
LAYGAGSTRPIGSRRLLVPFALGYADKNALALVQTRDARPVKRGDVHEDVLPAAVPNDEAEPLGAAKENN